uniref:Uncharacterized protein n=1 Tax=Knipowitschia caucasica TaxID=637954 RepID=A0AAV2JEK9_KNICA
MGEIWNPKKERDVTAGLPLWRIPTLRRSEVDPVWPPRLSVKYGIYLSSQPHFKTQPFNEDSDTNNPRTSADITPVHCGQHHSTGPARKTWNLTATSSRGHQNGPKKETSLESAEGKAPQDSSFSITTLCPQKNKELGVSQESTDLHMDCNHRTPS